VSEESKKVLVKDRVSSSSGVKEGGIKVAVREEYCDGPGQNRKREKKQDSS
jgi:hypothetical protein